MTEGGLVQHTEQTPPTTKYRAFKFRKVNDFLIDSLENSRLHFAPRARLNDPFDCNIDLAQSIKRLLAEAGVKKRELLEHLFSDPRLLRPIQEGIDTLGIFSMSMTLNETLMWSHYADDHKGIAICYEFEPEFLADEEKFFGASEVHYEQNAITDWLRENIGLFRTNHKEFIITLVKMILTSKAPSWKYECEARIIRPEVGLFDIPRSSLKAITFGLQTPKEEEIRFRSICEKHYRDAIFQRAVRANVDFGVEIEMA